MEKLYFGTAGKPQSTEKEATVSAVERVYELGLGCMEMEFVHGVQMGEQKAAGVAEVAGKLNIKLSAHAPYYINLNAREHEKILASQKRIIQTARIAAICEAQSVVVHTAFFMGDSLEEAYPKIKQHLKETLDVMEREELRITLRPEVMGKPTQFGSVEQVVRLCSELNGTAPCIDFAHAHAATGGCNTYREFSDILELVERELGRTALDNMHLHCSGIQYGPKGEQKHLPLEDSDFNYQELMQALKDHHVSGLLICESPILEDDALLMMKYYNELR